MRHEIKTNTMDSSAIIAKARQTQPQRVVFLDRDGVINKKLEGEVLEVLVDKKSLKNIPNQLSGRTKTNKTVVFIGEQELVGKLVEVKIIKSDTWTLYGELVKWLAIRKIIIY